MTRTDGAASWSVCQLHSGQLSVNQPSFQIDTFEFVISWLIIPPYMSTQHLLTQYFLLTCLPSISWLITLSRYVYPAFHWLTILSGYVYPAFLDSVYPLVLLHSVSRDIISLDIHIFFAFSGYCPNMLRISCMSQKISIFDNSGFRPISPSAMAW